MTSCTIIISHYESLPFLRATIRQIRKYSHPEIDQRIIVCDQSQDIHIKVALVDEYAGDPDVTIVSTKPLYSGYGLDFLFHNDLVKSDYVCQLHADAMPITDRFLILPIKLMEEFNLSFVGQFQFVSDGSPRIYPPEPFCAMSQCYNVAKTSTYKELSLNAGFTRFHNRPESGLSFIANDWAQWAKADYQARGSDDDVVAFHWQDKHQTVNKVDLKITGMIGKPEDGSSWGRVIDDVVFHFGSCREAKGVLDKMPENYQKFTKIINEEGLEDELIEELLSNVKTHISKRQLWNGKEKKATPLNSQVNSVADYLKDEYGSE